MTHTPKSPSRIRFTRFNTSLAAVVFLTLAGTGVASANWTAPAASTSSTVRTGTLTVSQAGISALGGDFTSTGTAVQTKTVAVTVANTGTVPSPYTLTLANPAGNAVASAISVISWPSTSTYPCLETTTPSPAPAVKNWTNAAALTGSLAAGASNVYCVRTSLTPSQFSATTVGPMTATIALSAAVGSWTSGGAPVAVTQNARDTTVPTKPGTPVAVTTRSQSTLTWAASSDNVAVAGYKIFRGATLLTTTTGPAATYTDTTVQPNTTYIYTVQAVDAAGNVSVVSDGVSVQTTWYKVTHSSGLCLDDDSSKTAPGNPILLYTCYGPPTNPNGSPNQTWKFNADGTVQVGIAGSSVVLRASTGAAGAPIVLGSIGNSRTTWKTVATSVVGQYQIQRADAAFCLDAGSGTPSSGTQLRQQTCADTAAQRFSMTGMN